MVSPPKPWEVARPSSSSTSSSALSATTTDFMGAATTTTATATAPEVPSRPSNLGPPASSASTSALTQQPYSSAYPRYGGGMYGGGYGSSMYGSSYGGYGSSLYGGGMGGYGSSMYGGYGGMGMGGYGGMGMGMGMGGYGQPMLGPDGQPLPLGHPSLTQQMEGATSQTFALLQAVVGTFGSLAQMLESSLMATHSSLFAMVGVADQLSHLKQALGSVLGLFGLVAWLRRRLFPRPGDELRREFRAFANGGVAAGGPQTPRASRKPLVVFLLAAFGLPYAMHRLIRALQTRVPPAAVPGALDPSQLAFARALHPFGARDAMELGLVPGDIVAVLSQGTDGAGEWWQGRTRDGREGWFPRAFVEVIRPAGGAPGVPVVPQARIEAATPGKTVD